jgi:membrane protein YdbS with pleckstrin-like domain
MTWWKAVAAVAVAVVGICAILLLVRAVACWQLWAWRLYPDAF